MFRRIARGGLLGIALWAATASPAAQATTFSNGSIEQFTDASTWIVEGRVQRVWTELDPDGTGKVWTRAEIAIDQVLKGPGEPETLIVDGHGGRYGDAWQHLHGSAVFSKGERVFLFLDVIDFGQRLTPVAFFQGKYTIRRAAFDSEPYARRVHPKADPDWVYDHRFLPHPDPEYRTYYSDLLAQVRARLEAGWDGQPIEGLSMERLAEINGGPTTVTLPPTPENAR